MITEELRNELSKISLEELIKFYKEEEIRNKKASATRRYTLGKLDVIVESSAVDKKNFVVEYSIMVPEGILCYVKANGPDPAGKLIKEINEIINKFQK